MKSLGWKTITATAAAASLAGLAIAAGPTQAASPAAGTAHVQPAGSSEARPALTPRQLAALPLTDRHLTRHEIANLAVVLKAYYVAEGKTLDADAFAKSFTKDGVFNDKVAGASYTGKGLVDVPNYMAGLFPDVHRDLQRITVNGDVVSIELAIQGTFEGPLETPAGTLKPNGSKIDVPTADFWYLRNGKVEKFDCFVGYTKMYSDMGVNLDWASAVNGS
ncbi:nuclear transport factor 2 family protein [Streptomyces spinoverrucosus]|uniref:nuclear transport factor 2 family protein n=1 Tax=Streptomyces spinoverrucosus TaxID=284043 RepID=UPI0018C36CCA|nr:nuclear transport factor 2 family protein [Streptomyces spinoverrucosus]MBG0853667.1 nuclear transport factor 2 family protein [Streptomyces spinoverrucosus]